LVAARLRVEQRREPGQVQPERQGLRQERGPQVQVQRLLELLLPVAGWPERQARPWAVRNRWRTPGASGTS
jgi:hypothetical protein